jgi:hypothetical protein
MQVDTSSLYPSDAEKIVVQGVTNRIVPARGSDSHDEANAKCYHFDSAISSADHSMLLFTETCNLMELDRAWLTIEPHNECALLYRYFGGMVHRVKDLLEYKDLLHECINTIKVQELI